MRPLAGVHCLLVWMACQGGSAFSESLRLHRENPRYLSWQGQSLIVIGSGEHYGAVLNRRFDFRKYLATLESDYLNHTRVFSGAAYVEPQGAFQIERNTLAPSGEDYLAPWARSNEPGYRGGGNRFNLEDWSPAYFERLREFILEAQKRKVVVEYNLFCPFYEEAQWLLSPFHPDNNINGVGKGVARTNVYTLDRSGELLNYQERFVRRVVAALRDLDGVYYEICNEPYFGGVTPEWQERMAEIIADAQASHSRPKMISRNIANHEARVEAPLPHISLYNFHYAAPPNTVAANWHLERPIGDNETGFRGTNNAPYRMEAWDFILAGGALFSHLDYSFTVGFEDGTFSYSRNQPGGGNPTLRRQFRILREFIEGFPFIHMRPQPELVRSVRPAIYSARALVEPGRAVAIYFRPQEVVRYSVRWTGTLLVPESGRYRIHATSNDGMRVWIDGQLVLDRWIEQRETEHSEEVMLEEGSRPLRIEYFNNGGEASAKLSWTKPGGQPEPIPPSAFQLPGSGGTGLRGEYFLGRDFAQSWFERVDPDVRFSWGTQLPISQEGTQQPLRVELDLPFGRWEGSWLDPRSGRILREDRFRHTNGVHSVEAPVFEEDLALRLIRR